MGLRANQKVDSLREDVASRTAAKVKDNAEMASTVHAEAVTRQFFGEAIRNPELTFRAIVGLSVGTFVIGVALIVVGLVAAVRNDNLNDTIVASVFGGGGVISTLTSLYTLARKGLRQANANHAQIRLVLTGFASELGHLRAFSLKELDQIERVNKDIRDATNNAVRLIDEHVKPDQDPSAPARPTEGRDG